MQGLMRVPPHDLMIEETILGAMLLNPKCKPKVLNLISKDDFYREAHSQIFDAICEVGADIVLIHSYLESKGLLEVTGGIEYLNSLVDTIGTSAGVESHCEKLKELSNKRWLIGECSHIAESAFQSWQSFDEIVGAHRVELIQKLSEDHTTYVKPKDLKIQLTQQIEHAKDGQQNWIKTGFSNIDRHIIGLEPGTVTGIIARPSMGKSALALNISDNVSQQSKGRTLFFSLESNALYLMRRRLSTYSHVFLSKIRAGDIDSDEEWDRLTDALSRIPENLIIFDSSKFKQIEALSAMSETIMLESPLDLIVIDHIQKMNTTKRTYSRHNEISTVSNKITSLAKDLKVPVLVLCQLNRESEKDGSPKPPVLANIKESGDVEQDLDCIIGLYRRDRESKWAQLECLKGRDTGTWKTYLKFNRFIQKFNDCDETEAEYNFNGSFGG